MAAMQKKQAAKVSTAIAVAAQAYRLPERKDDGRLLLQVTPAGEFRAAHDSRPEDAPAWRIDAEIARRVIERFSKRKTPAVIDYEHQTLHKEKNGQPAPAAGRMHELRWVEGEGLFAEATLTAKAEQHVKDGEYLYFSPVFEYAAGTGEVLNVRMGALTNDPAIDGMEALSLTAAATARFVQPQESTMNPLLKAVLAKLGLPETTTEDAAIAALNSVDLTALQAQGKVAAAALTALKLKPDATPDAVTAALTALSSSAKQGNPDPAKYVPVEVVNELKASVAALTSKQLEREIDDLVKPALEDGRLLPAQEAWARDLGKTSIAQLTSYLATAQPIAALTGTQTGGRFQQKREDGMTEDEVKIVAACGLTPEAYLKANPKA